MSRSSVPQHEFMLFVVRITLALWLVWAVVGSIAYWELAESRGWNKLGIEANVSIFLSLTLAGVAVIGAVAYAAYIVFRPQKRRA